jgi:hypothetical protein
MLRKSKLIKKRTNQFSSKKKIFLVYKPYYEQCLYISNGITLTKLLNYYSIELVNNSISSSIFARKLHFHNSILRTYPLLTINFLKNKAKFYETQKTLSFNFSRNRFFPALRTLQGETYLSLSLGLFMKFFSKSKSFMKSKSMYLILASFLRKTLLFSSFTTLYFIISKTPVYLKEMMSTLNDPVVSIYRNPFSEDLVDEKSFQTPFRFSMFLFLNNKAYGKVKVRKRGRLKRKITKRLVLLNRITD